MAGVQGRTITSFQCQIHPVRRATFQSHSTSRPGPRRLSGSLARLLVHRFSRSPLAGLWGYRPDGVCSWQVRRGLRSEQRSSLTPAVEPVLQAGDFVAQREWATSCDTRRSRRNNQTIELHRYSLSILQRPSASTVMPAVRVVACAVCPPSDRRADGRLETVRTVTLLRIRTSGLVVRRKAVSSRLRAISLEYRASLMGSAHGRTAGCGHQL